MKIFLTLLLSALSAFASTITGPVGDLSGAAFNPRVEFWPLSTPFNIGNTNIVGPPKTVPVVNGNFSQVLVAGRYLVKFPPTTNSFYIHVPNDTSTYSLAAVSTNVSSVTGIASAPVYRVKVTSADTNAGFLSLKLVAGSGVTITTNSAGQDETLTITAAGGSTYTNNTGLPGVVLGSGIGTNLATLATSAALVAADTAVSNGIVTGLAAGSYAINGALATNVIARGNQTWTLTNYFGTHQLQSPQTISNVFIDNQKGVFYVTNTLAAPGLEVINSKIENATITNVAYVFGGVALGFNSTVKHPRALELNNVSVYGDHYAMRHYPNDSLTKGAVNNVKNSRFFSRREAVEVWFGYWNFDSCLFDAAQTIKPSGTSTCISFGANDDSTNVFSNCRFVYSSGGSGDESIGFVGWLKSQSTFENCQFVSYSNTTIQTAIYNTEQDVKMTFNDCTFDLHGGLLFYTDDGVYSGQNVTNNIITFNDCFLSPFTNGIVVRNSSMTNYVRGGNLVLSNFENTNKVVFLDRIADTYPTFNVGVNYTNATFPCLMSVSFYAYGADNLNDFIAYDLKLDAAGDGTWDSTNSRIASDSTLLAGPVVNCSWVFPLNVGSRWRIETNTIATGLAPTIEGKTSWRIKMP